MSKIKRVYQDEEEMVYENEIIVEWDDGVIFKHYANPNTRLIYNNVEDFVMSFEKENGVKYDDKN